MVASLAWSSARSTDRRAPVPTAAGAGDGLMRADPAETAEPADSAGAGRRTCGSSRRGRRLGGWSWGWSSVRWRAGWSPRGRCGGVVAHRRRWAPVALVVAGAPRQPGSSSPPTPCWSSPTHCTAWRSAVPRPPCGWSCVRSPRGPRRRRPVARTRHGWSCLLSWSGGGGRARHWTGGGRVLLLAPARDGSGCCRAGVTAEACSHPRNGPISRWRSCGCSKPWRSVRRRGGSRWRARSARGRTTAAATVPPRQAFCPACPSAPARSPRWMRTSAPRALRISWRFRGSTSPC